MPSIYTRIIFFTTEVVAFLLFGERKDRRPGNPITGGDYLTAEL